MPDNGSDRLHARLRPGGRAPQLRSCRRRSRATCLHRNGCGQATGGPAQGAPAAADHAAGSRYPDGEAYYRRCLSILADIEEAETAFSGTRPKGLLHVDVHGAQARRFIVPALSQFFAAYPDIELYLSETDRYVDLVGEGIDCVLRSGTPTESDLAARRIALLREVTVASPDYVRRVGMPASWRDLDGHRMVGFRSSATGGVLPLEFVVDGTPRSVTLPMTFSVSGGDTYRVAALAGGWG